MSQATEARRFRTTVEALRMAAPVCIRLRWSSFAHCVETSHAGAEVLRSFGFSATVVPCVVAIHNHNLGMAWVGHTPQSAYAFSKSKNPPLSFEPLSFEQFQKDFPPIEHGLHMAIKATHAGESALIDLTLGQINEVAGQIIAPYSLVCFNIKWPDGFRADSGESMIFYDPHPGPIDSSHLDSKVILAHFEGLVGDLMDVTKLARSLQCDVDRFVDAVQTRVGQLPELA